MGEFKFTLHTTVIKGEIGYRDQSFTRHNVYIISAAKDLWGLTLDLYMGNVEVRSVDVVLLEQVLFVA